MSGRRYVSGCVENVSDENTHRALRSWSYWLDERGKIHVGHPATDNYVELRKWRWKTRPDHLVFRYRNSDSTRKYFFDVLKAFDAARIKYLGELTKKTKRPRALEIILDPYDPLTPRTVLNFAQTAFGATTGECEKYDLACSGRLRDDAADPPVRFYVPQPELSEQSVAFRFGYRVGTAVRRAVGWWRGVG